MITIIAGSRTVTRYKTTVAAIEACGWQITEVICGMCDGPDLHGLRWAKRNRIPWQKFPANWTRFGNRAGMMRNNLMALHGQALIAVWDGESSGTAQMIQAAQLRRLKIFVYNTKTKGTTKHVY